MSNLSNAFNEIELTDSEFTKVDNQVLNSLVIEFINACESIEKQAPNVDAETMYRYLITIMLNNA